MTVPRKPVFDQLCVIRGGGDLATGVAWRLSRAGVAVVVTELEAPLTVRRTVALSTAVSDGCVDIEGLIGRRAESVVEAVELAHKGEVAVMVSPDLPSIDADAVVDARVAKRNIDTGIDDAPLVIGLGPGFTAGTDCHAVVETMRGHHLGRVLWRGKAVPNTGTPGLVAGYGAERVLRAPSDGATEWSVTIGDQVSERSLIGRVGGAEVKAPFAGVIRGLVLEGLKVEQGLKIGDIDPRPDVNCHEISDKALAIGGGVVEAVLSGGPNR